MIPPPTTAEAALAASRAAVLAQGWVHAEVEVHAGPHSLTMSQTSGLSDGIQKISTGAVHATVLVVGAETFLSGNPAGLQKLYGVRPATVKLWGSHWLRLQAGDKPYASTTKAVTIGSLFDESSPHGSLSLLPARTMHGVKVVGVRGKPSGSAPVGATATLWIAVATNLPVAYSLEKSDGAVIVTASFSKWGAALTLAPPNDVLVLRAPLPLNGA